MNSLGLLQEFEQQFCSVTAEITSKICVSRKEDGNDSIHPIRDIEELLKDAHELLERMELEVRDSPQDQREKLRNRVKSYEVELSRLKEEYKKKLYSDKVNADESTRVELFGANESSMAISEGEEQRQRLLDNSEKLEITSARLGQSFKAAIESEQIGAQVLNDLQYQRNTLTRARGRLRDTDEDLDQSSRTLNSMTKRFMQNKFILTFVLSCVGISIVLIIYFKVIR